MLQPSLLFNILTLISRGWGRGGSIEKEGLLQNLTVNGGGGVLVRKGGLDREGWWGDLIEILRYIL